MNCIIKTLPADNGTLYITAAGQRKTLARFTGVIEVTERQVEVSVLGASHKGVKRIYASFVVCDDIEYQMKVDDSTIHDGRIFDAVADVCGERLSFAGLVFEASDPIKGTLTFEIRDQELIVKLLNME